jgi:nucleoside-diphosphate-sugar epimerase
MILITGASGNVGNEVLKQIIQTGVEVRAAFQSVSKAAGAPSGVTDLCRTWLTTTRQLLTLKARFMEAKAMRRMHRRICSRSALTLGSQSRTKKRDFRTTRSDESGLAIVQSSGWSFIHFARYSENPSAAWSASC